ncbi:MAG TPA: uroporphyrinogen decarboxylase family protein [Chthoniobacteraceae bacterium]|nr:uroporphyrinogen decarboxylase family protein [Chthoniobacteraceae bacterium]
MNRRHFLKTAAAATALGAMAPRRILAQSKPASKSKRDLMMAVLDTSAAPAYIPAAFFMHFGVKGDAALKAHLDHFHHTGMDFVKIQLDEQELTLPQGIEVKTPDDWAKIPILPEKWFEPTLALLSALVKEAKSEALIIQTLYSPYQMAKQAVPWQTLVKHVQQDPDAVCRGMENITLSLQNFTQAATRLGADGFYMCTQGGETDRIADRALFEKTIKAYDMMLYKQVGELTTYNIMHICDYEGKYQGFEPRFHDYPGNVVNVPLTTDGKPYTPKQAAGLFQRPIMGGLDRLGVLATGTPDQVRQATLEVLKNAPPNFILGADCTVDSKTPLENLQTAIRTAHEYRG